jgi:hypothetical protein
MACRANNWRAPGRWTTRQRRALAHLLVHSDDAMKAIRVHEYGGVDVLILEDLDRPHPRPGEVLVRHQHIGVNFIDIYQRRGFYRAPLPFRAGNEGAGIVEAVGPDVYDLRPGDRVAYAMVSGAYAEYACIPVSKAMRPADNVKSRPAERHGPGRLTGRSRPCFLRRGARRQRA